MERTRTAFLAGKSPKPGGDLQNHVFKPQVHYFLAVRPWASHLTSLILGSVICKTRIAVRIRQEEVCESTSCRPLINVHFLLLHLPLFTLLRVALESFLWKGKEVSIL